MWGKIREFCQNSKKVPKRDPQPGLWRHLDGPADKVPERFRNLPTMLSHTKEFKLEPDDVCVADNHLVALLLLVVRGAVEVLPDVKFKFK